MERIEKLAKIIVNHSIKVTENDRVLITYEGIESMPLVKAITKEVINNKGVVETDYRNQDLECFIHENISEKAIESKTQKMKFEVENYDSFVRICYRKSDYYDKNMDKDKKR